MPSTRWRRPGATARTWWIDLDRDWQSVVIGFVVVALIVAFDVRIPW